MKLLFWPSRKERLVRCRRGKNTYRPQTVPARTNVIQYNALPNSVVELVDQGKVIGTFDIQFNVPPKGMFTDVRPKTEDGGDFSQWSQTEDDDAVQPVVGELHNNGETVPRTDVVQVSSVDQGDARQQQSQERGPEGSTDGVHGHDDEPSVLHDRPTEGERTVSVTVENSGRDGLLSDEVRSSVGDESASGEPVLGREEHGDEAGGDSDPVYSWKQ